MKKTKTIIDEQYQKQFKKFSQKINPKPSKDEREKLKQEYLERRKSS